MTDYLQAFADTLEQLVSNWWEAIILAVLGSLGAMKYFNIFSNFINSALPILNSFFGNPEKKSKGDINVNVEKIVKNEVEQNIGIVVNDVDDTEELLQKISNLDDKVIISRSNQGIEDESDTENEE